MCFGAFYQHSFPASPHTALNISHCMIKYPQFTFNRQTSTSQQPHRKMQSDSMAGIQNEHYLYAKPMTNINIL